MDLREMVEKIHQRVNSSIWIAILLVIVLLVPLVIVWVMMFPFISDDMAHFLIPWLDFIEAHGYWHAFAYNFADYTPAYLYFLLLISYTRNASSVILIKVFSIVGDLAMAAVVFKIVNIKIKDRFLSIFAGLLALYSPMVWLNSALWGQCDGLLTFFLLVFVWMLIREKPGWAMLAFSIALAFKLQAILFAPLIGVLLFRKKIPWWTLVLIPVVYFISVLPAWLAGRSIWDLLTIYLAQSSRYTRLSMNAANLYIFITGNDLPIWPEMIAAGIGMAAYFLGGLRKALKISPVSLIAMSVSVLFFMPFLLPRMHERYFYLAAVMAVILAFYRKDFIWLAVALHVSTIVSYFPFLFDFGVIWVQIGAIINLISMIILVVCYYYWGLPPGGKVRPAWLAKSCELNAPDPSTAS